MAVDNKIIIELQSQIDEIIRDETPDYTDIYPASLHTHTIDDIPQLQMLFNEGRLSNLYDFYYNKNSNIGFILYTNGLLINYGNIKYNNDKLSTKILLPMSYNGNSDYSLFMNRIIDYSKSDITNHIRDSVDSSYNVYISDKSENSFTLKSNQLYIPEAITFSFMTFGFSEGFINSSE